MYNFLSLPKLYIGFKHIHVITYMKKETALLKTVYGVILLKWGAFSPWACNAILYASIL